MFNMQEQQAAGVIVVTNEHDGTHLWSMELNQSQPGMKVDIPSVMISYKEWLSIAPCRNENLSVSFTRDGEVAFDIDYGKDVLTWSMMRAIALWILLQCGVNAVRYKTRHSDLTARAQAIASLPSFTYGNGDGPSTETDTVTEGLTGDDDPLCAICLEGEDQSNRRKRKRKIFSCRQRGICVRYSQIS